MSTEFLLTTLVVVATPGTGVLYTLSAGLARGTRASIVAAFGCTLGILPHVVAAITGVAALLHTSAVAFQVVKYLGVAYLLWMAWSTFRDTTPLTVEQGPSSVPARKVVLSGVLLNLLNPKLTIFFVAFLPQFVARDAPGALVRMTALSLVFMAVTFVVFAAYGALAASVRTSVVRRPRLVLWLRRSFGAAFVALGARLATVQR